MVVYSHTSCFAFFLTQSDLVEALKTEWFLCGKILVWFQIRPVTTLPFCPAFKRDADEYL